MDDFEPYVKRLYNGRFFLFATRQASKWYDPLPWHYQLELEFLAAYANFGRGKKFIDGGCHHGLYGTVLAKGCEYYAIDLHQQNLDMVRVNCALNGIPVQLGRAAITNERGLVKCRDYALGTLDEDGDTVIDSVRLLDICPDASVVKLDIEGAEYLVLPQALDEMPDVEMWAVEIHPWWDEAAGHKDLLGPFDERGYKLLWIDRSEEDPVMQVIKPIDGEITLRKESTIFALKMS